MCMVFNQSIWHIWGSLLLSPKLIDHFLSDFIFKSHSLPWSKISNPLRFWISIDLNTLKNILGREMWSGLNVSDILNNFRAPPQFMMGGWLCVKKNEFWMILRYTRNSWKIHLGTHNHTRIIFQSETIFNDPWQLFVKSCSPSINDPFWKPIVSWHQLKQQIEFWH